MRQNKPPHHHTCRTQSQCKIHHHREIHHLGREEGGREGGKGEGRERSGREGGREEREEREERVTMVLYVHNIGQRNSQVQVSSSLLSSQSKKPSQRSDSNAVQEPSLQVHPEH